MNRSARQLSAILGAVASGTVVPFGAACSDLGPASDHLADDALVAGNPAVIEIHNGSGSVHNKIPDTAGAADTLTVGSGSGDIDLETP